MFLLLSNKSSNEPIDFDRQIFPLSETFIYNQVMALAAEHVVVYSRKRLNADVYPLAKGIKKYFQYDSLKGRLMYKLCKSAYSYDPYEGK
ncbi:MAG: hypothetical protein OEY56_00915 [Cyclobacteriaceae bacterium]|nr:hypothetical protein [Cyclobacteriaceae bacterium]